MSIRKRYSFVKSFSPELMYGSPGKYRKLSEDELYEEWLKQHSHLLSPSPDQEKDSPEFTKIYLNGPEMSPEKGLNESYDSNESSNGNIGETNYTAESKRGNEITNESWFNSLEESNVDGVLSASISNYPETNSCPRTTSETNENHHGQIENKGDTEHFDIIASKQEFICNKPTLSRGFSNSSSSDTGSEKDNRKNAVQSGPLDVNFENRDEEMGKPHSKGKYSFREAETAFGVDSSLSQSTENLPHYIVRGDSDENGDVILEESAVQFGWKTRNGIPYYEDIIVAENEHPVEMQVSTVDYTQETSTDDNVKVAYYGPVYLYPRNGPDTSTPRNVKTRSLSSRSSSSADGAVTHYHVDATISDSDKDKCSPEPTSEFGSSKWEHADFEVREEMVFLEETPQLTPRSDGESATSLPKEKVKDETRRDSTSSSSSSSSSASEKEKGTVEAEDSKELGSEKDYPITENVSLKISIDNVNFNDSKVYPDTEAKTSEAVGDGDQHILVEPPALDMSASLESSSVLNKNISDSFSKEQQLDVSNPEPIKTPDIQPMMSPLELESFKIPRDSLNVETNLTSPPCQDNQITTPDIQPLVSPTDSEAPNFKGELDSTEARVNIQSPSLDRSKIQFESDLKYDTKPNSDTAAGESTIPPDAIDFLRSTFDDTEAESCDIPEIVVTKSLNVECSPPRTEDISVDRKEEKEAPSSPHLTDIQRDDDGRSHLPVMPSCRIGSPKITSVEASHRELMDDGTQHTITIDGSSNRYKADDAHLSPEMMSVRPKIKANVSDDRTEMTKTEDKIILPRRISADGTSTPSFSSNSSSSTNVNKEREAEDVDSVSSEEVIIHIQRQDSAVGDTEDETSFLTAETSVQYAESNTETNKELLGAEPLTHTRNLSNTSAEIHKVIDKLDEIVVRQSDCVSVDSGTSSGGKHHGHFVVVAIDFGTAFSGYGFSFTRDPDSIHMMRKWEGGDPGVINQKTPTTMLLTPDGTFHSFGFSARNYYHDLEPKESKKWLYFEKFKMMLHHKQDLCKDTKLKASNGNPFPALTVFSYALRFFKEKALNELSDQSGMKIINEDIRWVITVPAIWKEPAKQFMRRAAYEAGIVSPDYPEQLLVALEPEAASIYCRKLRMYQLVPDYVEKRPLVPPKDAKTEPLDLTLACEDLSVDGNDALEGKIFEHSVSYNTVENLVRGSKYMVVDCGGGTVDITVHELDETGKLKELHKATGGPYGSMGVDLEFERLLCDIFGNDYIEKYKNEKPAGWVDLMIAFESRKQATNPIKKSPLNVSLPFSFIDHYKKTRKGHVDKTIKKYGDKEIMWSYDGMLRLTTVAMGRLFASTVEKIKEAVSVVLEEPDCKGVRYIFLVGGFSESPVLQEEIKQRFGHLLRVIIPRDTSMSVLRGAVMFGLDPTIVHVRRSRLTYGVGILNRFKKDKHPKENLVRRDSIDWCTNVFDKFVVVDQSVSLGDVVTRSYTPARAKQKTSIINIYCSDKNGASFITDPGVRKCGTLCLDLASLQSEDTGRKRREIKTKMFFGDTEIKVSATDISSGKSVKASIDFLNK